MSVEQKNGDVSLVKTESQVITANDVDSTVTGKKNWRVCKNCGKMVEPKSKYCMNCGVAYKPPFFRTPTGWILSVIAVVFIVSSLCSALEKPENVKNAEKLIADIGTVTINSENAILRAEDAVAKLNGDELKKLGKAKKLQNARKQYDELVILSQVEELENAIDAIGTVSLESEGKIATARELYNNAKQETKNRIKNFETLKTAEEIFSSLYVDKVKQMIDSIGTVTLDSEKKINEVRKAYNSLSPEDMNKVSNKNILIDAESKLGSLKKAAKKAELDTALAKLNAKYDKVKGITWYQPKNFPKYINTRSYFLPYIGKDSEGCWLRLKIVYTGDDWVFWDKIDFYVDGKRLSDSISYFEVERDTFYGGVSEYADIAPSDAHILLLRMIANSKETIIRFTGDTRKYDFTISASDKEAIKQVLTAYDLLKG